MRRLIPGVLLVVVVGCAPPPGAPSAPYTVAFQVTGADVPLTIRVDAQPPFETQERSIVMGLHGPSEVYIAPPEGWCVWRQADPGVPIGCYRPGIWLVSSARSLRVRVMALDEAASLSEQQP